MLDETGSITRIIRYWPKPNPKRWPAAALGRATERARLRYRFCVLCCAGAGAGAGSGIIVAGRYTNRILYQPPSFELDPRPPGYLTRISITTPIASALKSHYIQGFLEVSADFFKYLWIQVAVSVSEVKRPLRNRFGNGTVTN